MYGHKDTRTASDGRLIATQTVDIKTPCLTALDPHLTGEEILDGDKFHCLISILKIKYHLKRNIQRTYILFNSKIL